MAPSPGAETYDTFARPGDPGFSSFPKYLAEDTVSYVIYVASPQSPSEAQIRSRLIEIQKAATTLTKSLLKDYIWQREPFALSLSSPAKYPKPAPHSSSSGGSLDETWPQSSFLHGRTEFGDSIADEWVIVYILRELSKQFKDAWIRVEDADGEFLLVEAANAIPRWLNPEIASHRVWIHDGGLRIIPRDALQSSQPSASKSSRRPASPLSLSDALRYVQRHGDQLIKSTAIEDEAFYRLRNFPAQIAESMHTARVTIPRKLAYILHNTPAPISPAVEAFYLRDPTSLRPLKVSKKEDLTFPPNDCVTTSVRFTRVGYAQLKSQEISLPEVWEEILEQRKDSAETKWAIMGMKVACGFEMMVADPQSQHKRAVREIRLLLDDIENGDDELPADAEIESWPFIDEDDSWLDVNFEDFERELNGSKNRTTKTSSGAQEFGDKSAQENLRRIVETFEQFLNDDGNGSDGSESDDDMDIDDDDVAEENSDEENLADIMARSMALSSKRVEPGSKQAEAGEWASADDSDDETAIRQIADGFEAELRAAGALEIDPSESLGDDGAANVADDPRYSLAKNLLEAFKSESGAPGPAGNLLRSLGLSLPRDDG